MRQRVEHNTRKHAFSLVELVLVVIIIGIVSSIAVPRLSTAIARRHCASAALRVAIDTSFARQFARVSSSNVTIHVNEQATNYWLEGAPDPDHPGQAYEVQLNEAPYFIDTLLADLDGEKHITYDMWGMPNRGGRIWIESGQVSKIIDIDPNTGTAEIVPPDEVGLPTPDPSLPTPDPSPCKAKNESCQDDSECCSGYCQSASGKCKDA